MESGAKRKRKTQEERLADIDAKIAKKKKDLANLKAQREEVLHPGPTMRSVMRKAVKKGLTPQEIEKRLDLENISLNGEEADAL